MNPTDLLLALRRTVEQFSAYDEMAKALASTLELREVLELVMKKVSQLLAPQNWSLILAQEDGVLAFEICVGHAAENLKGLSLNPGEGIAGRVFQTGEARLVEDVREDPTFSPKFDRLSQFETRSVLAVPLRCKGSVLGVIELVNDVSARAFTPEDRAVLSSIADFAAIAIHNARVVKRLQELTVTDEHTGLFNARHLRSLLDSEVARSRRFHHPVSLVFIDLDGFKQVNDTHGHLIGSALLQEVGTLLLATCRQIDVVCRYGGDEFAVLLVETDSDAAGEVGRRICQAMAGNRFLAARGLGIRLSASIGVATFPDHASDASSLLERADRMMYEVKAAGRNGVRVAPTLSGSATEKAVGSPEA